MAELRLQPQTKVNPWPWATNLLLTYYVLQLVTGVSIALRVNVLSDVTDFRARRISDVATVVATRKCKNAFSAWPRTIPYMVLHGVALERTQKDLPGDMRYCHPGRSQEWVFADVPYRHSWLMAQRWKFSLENGTRTVIDLPLCLTIAKIVGCHNFLSARYREVSTEY